MPLNNDDLENFSHVEFNNQVEIKGLEEFTKNLEKHFFSEVTFRNCSSSNDSVNLVVELDCNLGILEMLHHFDKCTWGNFKCQENSFAGAVRKLKESNNVHIEVEEFYLFLQDTSIIVNRIYNDSISQQLENIFTELSEHSIHFTKGHTEIPFEIYVPVFEDELMENEQILRMNIKSANNNERDYFGFWGLYCYSEDGAVVYDLKNKSIIKGDLQMLNR